METGRRRRISAFTLLEVLIALSLLVTGLTWVAAGLSRQVAVLRLLETSRISHHLADHLLLREILRRDQDLSGPIPEIAGFHSSVRAEPARVSRSPLPDVEMERVAAEISWEIRGQPRSVRLDVGVAKKPRASAAE